MFGGGWEWVSGWVGCGCVSMCVCLVCGWGCGCGCGWGFPPYIDPLLLLLSLCQPPGLSLPLNSQLCSLLLLLLASFLRSCKLYFSCFSCFFFSQLQAPTSPTSPASFLRSCKLLLLLLFFFAAASSYFSCFFPSQLHSPTSPASPAFFLRSRKLLLLLLLSFAVASSTSPTSPAIFRSCKLLLLLLLLLLSFAAASSYFSRFSCFFSSQLQGSFARSKRALEEIYETGSNILTSMSSNKERLKVSYFCPRCGSCQCQKHMGVDIHGMHMDLKPQTLGRATRSGSRCKYLYSTFMVCCL